MGSAFAWLGQLFEWFGRFIPRWIILDTTEGAVKFKRGKNPVVLGPGVHWYWPVLTKYTEYPTAFQVDRLADQTVVTTDDKVIVVKGMLSYSVTDVLPLLAHTHSAVTTVKSLAMAAVHDVVCRMSWEELKQEQRKGTLDTKLRNAAKRTLEPMGVKVEDLVLTDLAPNRVLKLLQSTSQEEN